MLERRQRSQRRGSKGPERISWVYNYMCRNNRNIVHSACWQTHVQSPGLRSKTDPATDCKAGLFTASQHPSTPRRRSRLQIADPLSTLSTSKASLRRRHQPSILAGPNRYLPHRYLARRRRVSNPRLGGLPTLAMTSTSPPAAGRNLGLPAPAA